MADPNSAQSQEEKLEIPEGAEAQPPNAANPAQPPAPPQEAEAEEEASEPEQSEDEGRGGEQVKALKSEVKDLKAKLSERDKVLAEMYEAATKDFSDDDKGLIESLSNGDSLQKIRVLNQLRGAGKVGQGAAKPEPPPADRTRVGVGEPPSAKPKTLQDARRGVVRSVGKL